MAQEEAPFACFAEASTEAVTLFADEAYLADAGKTTNRKSTEQAMLRAMASLIGELPEPLALSTPWRPSSLQTCENARMEVFWRWTPTTSRFLGSATVAATNV